MINLCAFLVAVVVKKRHLILFMKIRRIATSKENLLFLVKKFSSDINSHFSFKWLYVRCCYQLDLRTCLQVDMLKMQMENRNVCRKHLKNLLTEFPIKEKTRDNIGTFHYLPWKICKFFVPITARISAIKYVSFFDICTISFRYFVNTS